MEQGSVHIVVVSDRSHPFHPYQVDKELDGDEFDEVPDGEEGVVGLGAGHCKVLILGVRDSGGGVCARPSLAAAVGKLAEPLGFDVVPFAGAAAPQG